MAGIDPKFYYLTLGLLGLCTLVGLIVAYRFQREVNNDLAPPTERDLLGPLEKAYYSGLMREEEFERIQESMAKHKGGDSAPPPKVLKAKPRPVATDQAVPIPEPETEEEPIDRTDEITPTGDSAPGREPG